MNVTEWSEITTLDQRKLLADNCNTSVAYIYQISQGHRNVGHDLAKLFAIESTKITPDSPMTLAKLRPDIWGEAA